jgi:hypothetical protein
MSMSKVTRFAAAILCFHRAVDQSVEGSIKRSGDKVSSRVDDGSVENSEGERASATWLS